VGCHGKQDARREKDAPAQRKNVARGLISCFKRGLRQLQSCLQRSSPRRACGLSGKLMGGKAGQALVSEPIPSSGQPLNYASKKVRELTHFYPFNSAPKQFELSRFRIYFSRVPAC
jgi:hypothetical protein